MAYACILYYYLNFILITIIIRKEVLGRINKFFSDGLDSGGLQGLSRQGFLTPKYNIRIILIVKNHETFAAISQ